MPTTANPYESLRGREDAESTTEKRARWISISACYFCTFIMFCQQSCYWTSLWPYMSQVDPTVSESFVGFVIAAYSIGQGIAAPLFGLWSNRTMNTRKPIICGVSINVCGNLIIALIEAFPDSSRHYVFLVARFVCGLGAGCTGTVAAYIAMASFLSERNRAFSIQSAMISLAVLSGPGVAAIMTPIGYPGLVLGGFFHLDMYSCIAYFVVVLGLILLLVMIFGFRREHYVCVDSDYDGDSSTLSGIDWRAVYTCILLRFTLLFGAGCDESIASAFTMAMFNWSRKQAVFYNSLLEMCGGIFGFILNLTTGSLLLRYFRERTLMLVGLCSFMSFYFVSFSYPTILEPLEYVADVNGTKQGCYYEWCKYTTRIHLWQFIMAYVCFDIAFPIAFTSNTVLYSKVLGPRKQGFLQGISMGSGNVATAVAPMLISNLFEYYGPRLAWIISGSVGVLCLVNLTANFKHMVPFKGATEDSEARRLIPSRQASVASNYSNLQTGSRVILPLALERSSSEWEDEV